MMIRACMASLLVVFVASAYPQSMEERPVLSHISVELPNLQSPISLIIDDPSPIYADRLSPPELEKRKAEGKGVDMWTFFDNLLNLFDEYGMKGKFTVIPYVKNVGMADKLTDPKHKKQLEEFVAVVKKRLAPRFDITPEMISHGTVINVETDQPLGVTDPEHVWSQTQDEETLEKYIGRALLALKNIGLEANGVTSPCDFGAKNEGNYMRAIHRALKRVNGVKLAWYFCQSDNADYLEPRLMYLDWNNQEAVINIMPTNAISDIGLTKRFGRDVEKNADVHITTDGKSGVFPAMIASRSYIVFYKHWGCLYDGGHETGLKALREVAARTHKFYGDCIQWMTCSEIARYYAAAKTYRITLRCGKDSVEARLSSAFICPSFTMSFTVRRPIQKMEVRAEGQTKTLTRLEKRPHRLEPGSWFQEGERVFVCFDLAADTTLSVVY